MAQLPSSKIGLNLNLSKNLDLFLTYLKLIIVVSTVMSGLHFARFGIVDYVTYI